jgi:K+-sensing histidine kinase KdpD
VPVLSTGVVYLLAVLLVSTGWGFWLGLLTAVLSAAAFNFWLLESAPGEVLVLRPEPAAL